MTYEPFSLEEFKEGVEDFVPRPKNPFEELQYLEILSLVFINLSCCMVLNIVRF